MPRTACLVLLCVTACIGRPEVETTLLAELPGLRLTFYVYETSGPIESSKLLLEVAYDEVALGTCARVHESLRARVDDRAMSIRHAGSGSRDFGCRYPELGIEPPPPAESLILEDNSKQITINLGARLVRLVPPQPWTVTAGQTVRVPYAPASALPDSSVSLVLASLVGGEQEIPFSVQAAEISFPVPDRVGAGSMALLVAGGLTPTSWPCSGAMCRVVGPTRFDVPIQIQPPASM
jgi:hypothetical protein